MQQSVLVTGASSGIGAACVKALDALGWRVFAGVRRDEDGRRLQDETSGQLTPVILDVTDRASIERARRSVEDEIGTQGLFGLVNNAGMAIVGPVEFVDPDLLRRQLEVNVIGQVQVIQAFGRLVRQARGRIVNISSVSGRIAMPFLAPYACSKFALEAVSDALRLELKPHGVRVSIVEPGSVATPIWQKTKAQANQARAEASEEATNTYGQQLDAVRRITRRAAETAESVDIVVKPVVHALTARRPKIRYLVGREAKMATFFRALLPTRTFDWLIARNLR